MPGVNEALWPPFEKLFAGFQPTEHLKKGTVSHPNMIGTRDRQAEFMVRLVEIRIQQTSQSSQKLLKRSPRSSFGKNEEGPGGSPKEGNEKGW